MLPRIFGEDLFDDFFNDDFMMRPMRNTVPQMMKTDVRELDGAYELDMDLPGFKKEDIKVDLKDGTLTISATRNAETSEKDDNGKLIRQERYSGNVSRSFYVGENLEEKDIHAKFENGTLTLTFPKELEKKAVEEKHFVSIEG